VDNHAHVFVGVVTVDSYASGQKYYSVWTVSANNGAVSAPWPASSDAVARYSDVPSAMVANSSGEVASAAFLCGYQPLSFSYLSLWRFGSNQNAQFTTNVSLGYGSNTVRSVGLDTNGDVYLAMKSEVQKFNSTGQLWSATTEAPPQVMAVDDSGAAIIAGMNWYGANGNGYIYGVTPTNCVIQKFANDSTLLWTVTNSFITTPQLADLSANYGWRVAGVGAGTSGSGPDVFITSPAAVISATNRITIARDPASTNQIILSWSSGTLLETTNLFDGSWVTNSSMSPLTNMAIEPQKFYRLK
jgi:hypothetical protein